MRLSIYVHDYSCNPLHTWLGHIICSAATHALELMHLGFCPFAVNLGLNEPLLTEDPSNWLPGSAC
jgi:hypothetical protein